jgi:hypothetical protein
MLGEPFGRRRQLKAGLRNRPGRGRLASHLVSDQALPGPQAPKVLISHCRDLSEQHDDAKTLAFNAASVRCIALCKATVQRSLRVKSKAGTFFARGMSAIELLVASSVCLAR